MVATSGGPFFSLFKLLRRPLIHPLTEGLAGGGRRVCEQVSRYNPPRGGQGLPSVTFVAKRWPGAPQTAATTRLAWWPRARVCGSVVAREPAKTNRTGCEGWSPTTPLTEMAASCTRQRFLSPASRLTSETSAAHVRSSINRVGPQHQERIPPKC